MPRRPPDTDLHTVYVQMREGGEFFATCWTCGSNPFPYNRKTLEEAEADARRHGRLHHIYDRDALIAWEGKHE